MGVFIKHEACEDCGSSDGKAVYDDTSSHCFVCQATKASKEFLDSVREEKPNRVKSVSRKEDMESKAIVSTKPAITEEEKERVKNETSIKGNLFRGVRDDVFKMFGVRQAFDENADVLEQYYPCTQEGQLVGYKIREVPKNFRSIGRTGADCELFMQFKFNRGGKYCLLVEGEVDSLSAYQMLADYNKTRSGDFETAVVSATTGANSKKQIAAQYKFFDSFENIILCMDNDQAGQKAAEELIKHLPKGKVKLMQMRFKDPNEYLTQGKQKEFVSDFYNAKTFVPVGVLPSGGLYDRIVQQTEVAKVPFPPFMKKLNEMFIGGMPLGYIFNVAADTGVGKCFAAGTKIRMYDMTVKNVEDIVDGDLVMGDDGTKRTVKGCTTGFDRMFVVEQNKGNSYTVNSAHILSLKPTKDYPKFGWKKGQVVNINVLDYLALPKTVQSHLKGYKADISNYGNDEIAHDYLLGLWLGDGTSAKPQITFNKNETEVLEWFEAYCNTQGFTQKVSPSNNRENCKMVDIKEFRATLNKYQLLNNKRVPHEFLCASNKSRLNILAGVIDADGFLQNGCYTLTMKNTLLVWGIITLAQSLGFNVSSNTRAFKKCQNFEGENYVCVTISGNISRIPVKLYKRKANDRKINKDPLVTGIWVTEVQNSRYYGFQVDGNHLFCLEDFTVTHNTTYVNEMIYYWIFNSPHKIGIVSMELDAGQYGEVLLSRHISRKLALMPDISEKLKFLASDDIKKKSNELMFKEDGNDRFFLLDNRDGTVEEIQDTIEELVVACNCKVIILDPLQDILDGLSNEEQAVFMKWAKGFIKSHGITFVFINHMRKSENSGEMDIMGSSTIIKSAGANIILKRDKLAEDPVVRNTTTVFVPKNRICGLTGPAGAAYYDNQTHTLYDLQDWLEGTV